MRLLGILSAAVFLLTGFSGPVSAQQKKPWYILPIPASDPGYYNLKTQLFTSQKDLDEFLEKVKSQSGWDNENREKLVKILTGPPCDLDQHALLFITQTEASGKNIVTFSVGKLRDEILTAYIQRKSAELESSKLAYFGFACLICRKNVRLVELNINPSPMYRELFTIPPLEKK